jgi:hypothetical protein
MQELPAAERNGELGEDVGDGEGRGRSPAKPRTGRLKSPPPVTSGRGRKLTIADGVYERLAIEAKRRKTTMSAMANEVLDKNLDHFEVIINVIKRTSAPAAAAE